MWNFTPMDVPAFMFSNDILAFDGEREFIASALNAGGYIAGGCARVVGIAILRQQHVSSIDRYVGDRQALRSYLLGGITNGDVDVFFRSEADVLSSTEIGYQHSKYLRVSRNTQAGWGVEHISKFSNIVFQFITKIWSEPREMVNNFDLANAKVYLDSNGVHWTDEWLELELSRTLAIDDFTRQNLLWRVNKWLTKHRYLRIRQDDEEKLFEHSLRMLDRMKNNEFVRFDKKVHPDAGLAKIWQVVRSVNMLPESMISFAILFDSYRNLTLLKDAAKELGAQTR